MWFLFEFWAGIVFEHGVQSTGVYWKWQGRDGRKHDALRTVTLELGKTRWNKKSECSDDSHSTNLLLTWLRYLVSWRFEPSQPQRITSGLNTNFTLSPSHSFHKSSYHKSCFFNFFFSLFIFRGHSTREPASNRVTYSILRAYTGTGVSHGKHMKKQSGEVLEKMQVNGPEG